MHGTGETVPVSIGILAGGKSRRMGCNKALMELNNETMLARIIHSLSGCGPILVSASEKGIYEQYADNIVYDENRDIGPIEGIRRLVAESDSEYVFICAADMPFVNADIVTYISQFISSDYDCFVIADEEHIHPLCAIYSKRILSAVNEAISEGRYRLTEILKRVRCKYISIEQTKLDKKVLKNVNTREEYIRLSFPVVFAVSGYSNAGKTWLIEKLINGFIGSGYSVGVIKHDGSDHIAYADGTDTFRCMERGAVSTAVYSDTAYVLTGRNGSCEDLIEYMKRESPPPDVIILEGMKGSKYPKVEIVKRSVWPRSEADPETLICISTDCISPSEVKCPVFAPDDAAGIFSCISDYFGIGGEVINKDADYETDQD